MEVDGLEFSVGELELKHFGQLGPVEMALGYQLDAERHLGM